MKRHSERIYWMSNREWYRVNLEKDCFELTASAPERARRSFEEWKKPCKRTLRDIWRLCRAYLMF